MAEKGMDERRRGVRVDYGTDVSVSVAGMETRYRGDSKDLSQRGIYIRTEQPLAVDTLCHVTIKLQGLEDDVILRMEGHVVRVDLEGYAIYFDSVDLDTFTHLKNIVRYNTPDGEAV